MEVLVVSGLGFFFVNPPSLTYVINVAEQIREIKNVYSFYTDIESTVQ